MVSSTAFKSSERVSYSRSRGPGTLARRHLSGDTRTRSTPSNRGPRRNRRHALVEESELVLVILGASLFDAHSTGYSTPKSVQARAPFFLPLPLSLRCSGLAHQDQKNFLFLIPLSFEARHCALQFSQRGHTDPRLGRLDVIGGI